MTAKKKTVKQRKRMDDKVVVKQATTDGVETVGGMKATNNDTHVTNRIWANALELTAMTLGSGISFEHVRFLATVASGIDTTSEMQNTLGYSRASTSRAVTTLAKCGMVKTQPMQDGRGRRIVLTEKARMYND